jgi:Apea-like HEPN
MKTVSYITCFRKLRLTEPISGHLELMPGVNISNDPVVMANFLTPQFAAAAGAIEMAHLIQESNLVFGEFDTEDLKESPPELFLVVILAWIDTLLKNAWLLKDHAMECDAAFLRVEMASGTSWTRNFLAIRPSFSDGYTDKDIEMSIADLMEWGKTTDLVEGYLCETHSSSLRFMMEKGYARSGRAMQFVVAARRAQDIAFKIANYCSALETLFTTESTELAHKLAERVAFFLGDRGHNRRAVFATIKSAYGVRSKLVHGDTLKPSQMETLPALSTQCDVYLRTILLDIFNSEELKKMFDSHNEAIEDYFAQLILGTCEPDSLKLRPR